ncbi:MAG: hypothetical protein ACRCZG_01050, partial [Culicoidibacterales bacterium]
MKWYVYFRGNIEAGPFDTEQQAESKRSDLVDTMDYITWDNTEVRQDPKMVPVQYESMQLLRELLQLSESESKKKLKKSAKAVYRRDYL